MIEKLTDASKPLEFQNKINEIIDNLTFRNVGETVFSPIKLEDAKLHLADGTALQVGGVYDAFITHMAELYAEQANAEVFVTEDEWQQTVSEKGICSKYVYVEGEYLRLPKYNNKLYTGGGNATVVGNGMTLGLQSGDLQAVLGQYNSSNSFFHPFNADYQGTQSGTIVSNSSLAHNNNATFGVTTDPEKSGLIAQLSDITTAVEGYWYIVVGTSTKTDVQVNIDNVLTNLNNKADRDLSNTKPSQSFKEMSVGWGMPDYSTSVSVSGLPFTAERNGWFFVSRGASTSTWYLYVNGVQVAWESGEYVFLQIPLSAGDVVTESVKNAGSNFMFVSMKGANQNA